MKKRYAGLLFIAVTLFTSCFKEDDPIILPPPGEVQVMQLFLGTHYENQIYLQFSSQNTVTNSYSQWDLTFDARPEGYHIWVNGGNLCKAASTGSSAFDYINSYSGADWKWDAPSWNPDSTAIGEWVTFKPPSVTSTISSIPTKGFRQEIAEANGVFLINRGDTFSEATRYWKIMFQSVSRDSFTFKYANLKGGPTYTKRLFKDPAYNYIHFSFDGNGTVVYPEPLKKSWDILFTRYRYIFNSAPPGFPPGFTYPLPYPVEGVLINPYKTVAVKDSSKSFAEIDYAFARTLNFVTRRDVIGFDWKNIEFSGTSPQYVVEPNINYIIKDQQGVYWKLHFLDFYNNQKEKGYPKFEFQRL